MKKTTLKWNCLFAAVAIGGVVAATSCVKNEESDGVKAIREAQASKVSADAAYRQADAALKQAETALKQADAKQAEVATKWAELDLKKFEALYDGELEAAKENLKSDLLTAQKAVLDATKSLATANQELAEAEAEAKADHPNLDAWQGLYKELYATTGNPIGLYPQLTILVDSLNTAQSDIIEATFSKSSVTKALLEKDSIAANDSLTHLQYVLNVYEPLAAKLAAGDTLVPSDTATQGKLTTKEWKDLKSAAKNGQNALTTTIGQLKSDIGTVKSGLIKRCNDLAAKLAQYYADLYSGEKNLKVLEQKATDYEAQIELVKFEIANIKDRMAKLLE